MLNMSRKLRSMLESINDEISKDLLTSNKTDHGDYLGVRSGFITFLPHSRDTPNPYASSVRKRGKPSRIARKFVEQSHNDAEYEAFHNAFAAISYSSKNIRIYKGLDIVRVYNEWYDTRRLARGVTSCMTNANLSEFALYTTNPHSVRILTLWDTFRGNEVVVARALIWATDKGIYVDRIYGSDVGRKFLQNYVDKKGWLSYHSSSGHYGDEHMTVTVKVEETLRFPYLDTFSFSRGEGSPPFGTKEGILTASVYVPENHPARRRENVVYAR